MSCGTTISPGCRAIDHHGNFIFSLDRKYVFLAIIYSCSSDMLSYFRLVAYLCFKLCFILFWRIHQTGSGSNLDYLNLDYAITFNLSEDFKI